MPRLLTNEDYTRIIQDDDLEQIIEDNYNILLAVEQAGQSQMIGYLKSRYITTQVFTDTTLFSTGATYRANNLVQYTAPAYDDTLSYSVSNHVVFSGIIYTCISGTTGQTAPNSGVTFWSGICADKTFYYALQPLASYDNNVFYSTGDVVFYDDGIYQAKQNIRGVIPGQSTNLMVRYANVPNYLWTNGYMGNPVPTADTQNWLLISGYSFSNQYCENPTFWVQGDNRNALIVQYLLDIVLYNITARLSPRAIPQLRYERYQANNYESGGAIGWLKMVSAGDVNADLPEIILPQGISIVWGSNPRNISSY